MLARDAKTGDRCLGWTVAEALEGTTHIWHPEIPDDVEYEIVLLSLERTFSDGDPEVRMRGVTETKRLWLFPRDVLEEWLDEERFIKLTQKEAASFLSSGAKLWYLPRDRKNAQ